MCRWFYLLPSSLMLGCLPVIPGPAEVASSYTYGAHALVATADNRFVTESSGVVASHLNADVYWTHNDSGHRPRVWAFRLNADDIAASTPKHLGYVQLDGMSGGDWEDIARGPGNTLYLFDGGDNRYVRTDKRILRLAEPRIDPAGEPVRLRVSPDVIRFEYPDPNDSMKPTRRNAHRYDAESLFVHPASADLFIVTKRGPRGVAARVYTLRADTLSWNSTRIHVLQFVTDLSITVGMATGADITPDGRHVVIRNYFTAYEFTAPADSPFEALFNQTPENTLFLRECQGEAICYSADGGSFITTSEARHEFFCPSRMPVYVIPAVPAQPTE